MIIRGLFADEPSDEWSSGDTSTEFIDRGESISGNDDIGEAALGEAVGRYTARKRALSALVAEELIDLSEAYGIAQKRAEADERAGRARSTIRTPNYFAWQLRSIMGEFALPNRESDVVLQNRAYEARQLVEDYSEWLEPIRSGEVSIDYARAFLRDARPLNADQVAKLSPKVLQYAKSHTVSQTKRFVKREVAKVGAENVEAAQKQAREQRSVTVADDGLGMSMIFAYIPTELAVGTDKHLTLDARAIREANALEAAAFARDARRALAEGRQLNSEFVADERTLAQIRADVFVEMLLCVTPESLVTAETAGARRVNATVSLTVPVLSLLRGREDGREPALVDGLTPIEFDEARQLAAEAPLLQRILTDPINGQVVAVDTYQPSAAQRRFLRVRDVTCRFAGCMRPAAGSDIDHTIPHSECGPTKIENLAHLCRGHHVQKTRNGGGCVSSVAVKSSGSRRSDSRQRQNRIRSGPASDRARRPGMGLGSIRPRNRLSERGGYSGITRPRKRTGRRGRTPGRRNTASQCGP